MKTTFLKLPWLARGWPGLVMCALALLAACQAAPTPAPTATPSPTASASPSASPTAAASELPASEPAPTTGPTPAPPSATAPPPPTHTSTPTAQAAVAPTLAYYNITPAADATLVTPFPTPVATQQMDADVVNVLAIGTDYRASERGYRTDTLIIVSIRKETGLVTLLSIPRDLYIYAPTRGMMRINQVFNSGESAQYPGGGAGLLRQVILYNLGIPIHYYALVNFAGFLRIVDTIGGIDVPVNCQLTEYKIKDPSLDESNADNYELYTQPIGVTHMDGALALWYARARPVGGDFFRGYRQRQVLRAIYHAALQANLLPQIPALYDSFKDTVQTDMGVWDMMQFAPLAARVDDASIRSLHIGPNQTTSWRTPRGEDVLLPRPDTLPGLIRDAFTAPSANQLERPLTSVEIWNATGRDDMGLLAAETLINEGFVPVLGTPDGIAYPLTQIVDFTTSPKGSPIKKLQYYTRVADKQIIAQPDASQAVQFRLILGEDYNPCPRVDWMDLPKPTATPAPAATDTPPPAEPPPTDTPTP